MASTGIGFGKTILFGEHFVVYGLPSIASAIESKTVATVERSGKYELVDNRLETPGYKKEKFDQQVDSTRRVFEAVKIDPAKTPVKITLAGDLIAASGVGASAASCVAIARALSKEFNLNLNEEQINAAAYEGEKGYHGTPSGIDNTVSTYGGLIWFKKGTPPLMERISMRQPAEIIIADTGITSDTAAVVADVKKSKEADPAKFEKLFSEEEALAKKARAALESSDLPLVGKLMDENHALLQKIGVSCPELEDLVSTAKNAGAIGAKLTGTGRGGNIVALTPGKQLQEQVAKAIEAKGFRALRTRIGIKPPE